MAHRSLTTYASGVHPLLQLQMAFLWCAQVPVSYQFSQRLWQILWSILIVSLFFLLAQTSEQLAYLWQRKKQNKKNKTYFIQAKCFWKLDPCVQTKPSLLYLINDGYLTINKGLPLSGYAPVFLFQCNWYISRLCCSNLNGQTCC